MFTRLILWGAPGLSRTKSKLRLNKLSLLSHSVPNVSEFFWLKFVENENSSLVMTPIKFMYSVQQFYSQVTFIDIESLENLLSNSFSEVT